MSEEQRQRQSRGLGKLLFVVLGAFAFTFSLVPMYRIVCERVLGIRLAQGPNTLKANKSASAAKRMVTITFDGGVNSHLPWSFHPNALTMQVEVGRPYTTSYFAKNGADNVVVGSAVPSVAPARASKYFVKTECFCFTAQTLQAGQQVDMPVRFIVDPALPADIKNLTLSYTFFRNDPLTAEARKTAPVAGVILH